MEKLPTAEELINKIYDEFYETNGYYLRISNPEIFAKTIAIEFAKLHVEAALKAASENAETEEEAGNPYDPDDRYYVVDKESILNSYPLDNIK